MCFFPKINYELDAKIPEFECGQCPECLRRRSNRLALKVVAEASSHSENCVLTLTYDNYRRDPRGRIIGELPPNRDLKVSVRDIQLFMKRLRKAIAPVKIRYLISAEYGKHTHRAHYHVIILGYRFPDCVFYKMSGRGHPIYKSKTLTSLWSHGICTVDNVRVTAASARYCTKYTVKDKGADTFSLMSHHMGEEYLLNNFNGRGYYLEGKLFPIPKNIWNLYLEDKFHRQGLYDFTIRYKNKVDGHFEDYDFNQVLLNTFREYRDLDEEYKSYIDYWRSFSEERKKIELPAFRRILQLPDEKYGFYKALALKMLPTYRVDGIFPRMSERQVLNAREKYSLRRNYHLPFVSCPKTANDTKTKLFKYSLRSRAKHYKEFLENPEKVVENPLQMSFDMI